MQTWRHSPRTLLALALIIGLCAGLFAPRFEQASAQPAEPAPLSAVDELNVVISEFRFVGPEGGNDEFIEIYNPSGGDIPLNGWTLRASNSSGATNIRYTFGAVTLQPGQYYLIVHPQASAALSAIKDAQYVNNTGITEDGGIALVKDDGTTIVDAVGLSSGSAYKEGTPLNPLTGSSEQSYERKRAGTAGNCFDTDNNSADFVRNNGSSNPRNSYGPFSPCLVVKNVDATTDGPKNIGDPIAITVKFSNNVNVTGGDSIRLQLETGLVDRQATYQSGTGTDTLTFLYTVQPGDSSFDLDYVSANALTLNGGTIVGAIGDAVIILPKPGTGSMTGGSLGFNKSISIDGVSGDPYVVSIMRRNPASQFTNLDSVTFRVTFSEAVTNVGESDFTFSVTPATINVTPISHNVYDITISNDDIVNHNGNVSLGFVANPSINDPGNNPLDTSIPPSPNEFYTIDNIGPTPTITALSPISATLPVTFNVDFGEVINPNTFTPSDITQTGSVTSVIWTITNLGDNQNFTISATTSGSFTAAPHTITPFIAINRVEDVAGNTNFASNNDALTTITDGSPPMPTITLASGQATSTYVLPIRYVINFGEPINTSTFVNSDIVQSGTATGVVWSISNPSGDRTVFNLNATSISGSGTVIPSIAVNRVTDLLGYNNTSATGPTVTYSKAPPNETRAILINEVAWAGTGSGLSEHEWIELYNPGNTAINITGWKIVSADGNPNITLNGVIPAKGYFLLERGTDNVISDIAADQIYPGSGSANSLSNSGEVLYLRDVSNKIIDTANLNGGSWPKGSSTTYATMERSGNIPDSDSAWHTNTGLKRNGKNANGGNILGTPRSANSTAPTPTPTRTPTKTRTPTPVRTGTPTRTPTRTPVPPPPSLNARLIINEVLARPGFDWNRDGVVDVYDEFIEIKNNSPFNVELRGWRLDDQASNNISPFNLPNQTLRPGERIAFFRPQTNIPLSDGGGTVRLLNSQNLVFDEFTYVIAKTEDRSFCRIPDGGFSVLAWQEDCIPTPNLPNTLEGAIPSLPGGFDSPVCDLPDTIPANFFAAECRGYGANIWNPYYWDQFGWAGRKYLPEADKKWQSFIE